jgi:hypothetical protein
VNRPKPRAAKAIMAWRNVRICFRRENTDSTDMGVGRVSMTSPSTSFISNWPRGASGMRRAKKARTSAGSPRMKNAQRQPSGPPARVAMAPTNAGLMAPMSRPLPRLVALRRPRTPMG